MAAPQVWGACLCCEGWRPQDVPTCPECSAVWSPLGPPEVGQRDAFDRLVTEEDVAGGVAVGLLFMRMDVAS